MNREEKVEVINKKWFNQENCCDDGKDSEFKEIIKNFVYGDNLSRNILTDKQKVLIILTVLTTVQTLKPLIKYTKAALNLEVKPEEITETLYQCAPYIGISRVQAALDEVNEVFVQQNIKFPLENQATVDEATRFIKGLTVQQSIFGKENINTMRENAPEELKHIQDYLSAYCFGDYYTRGTLDLKMRELITFSAIICLGGCEPQAKAHASANISVGNTKEMLIEAATQCLPFIGFPRTLNAIGCISAVCK
ncbi:carboxymuconolactone decarboxylase family protein [Megamonas hypermegale]|uniref:carboxymuconolactone decarboxylase family protein n=1 Tax=Megamonas hypermegale TaxID=158847 RepID=UPI00255C2845|nr:carboxymuconolactone decarboxylase family protein [Megamonas hypermegale]